MIRELGRWLFGIPLVRKSALALLIFFPSLRRQLRIYVGVEGNIHLRMDGANEPDALAPRAAEIFADLTSGTRGWRS